MKRRKDSSLETQKTGRESGELDSARRTWEYFEELGVPRKGDAKMR